MASSSEIPPSVSAPVDETSSPPHAVHNQPGDGHNELDWSALHAEDSAAGGKIGRLLAGMFLLLLVLMIATTVWTFWNQNLSSDPHATNIATEPGLP